MGVETGTGLAIGGGLSALGNFFSSKAANEQQPGLFVPEDLKELRGFLSDAFTNPDIVGGSNVLSQMVQSNFAELMSPEFRESILRDPFDSAERVSEERRPAFLDNLNNTFQNITSQFGAGGLRPGSSSDLNLSLARAGGEAERGFESDISQLIPGFEQNQLSALGLLASIPGQAAPFALQQQFHPLDLAVQYATSFPGGQFNPAGGNSPYGGLASDIGGSIATIPVLQSVLNSNT
jgi:hypothetical protein